MIEVSMFRSQGNITGFEISGHAESGPYGHDLVCAAVSAVSFGTVNAIVSLCEFEPHVVQGGEGGYLKITLPDNLQEPVKTKAQTLLEGMQVSLQTIEQDYDQYIHISQR
ncbi:ribosomal-processing cysteine protease Prp [Halobacillus litoralis]|uniref:Ribosomal processing cysteine protease Prp n=1 Tax=Halobacillus litoralis TaxID=45668 RepID=A0A845DQY6_9BACI|nr:MULTISPECIES: ribosomal-processing cysteine protease Prp [Halobacillus]MCA1021723.1 ribosomal-processing cysteine protease Prp [Halobacillus litoralis]MYL19910.1 ribosomal-processing cysteine protease Prp [Halobacillus litoralis]MYL29056.1 ribosomal-processing cysteine protease Prp [Halobacillus halophilus]MYL37307.1 ribosomal-processing cysteine protease Prp [Halobacillus litoralis]